MKIIWGFFTLCFLFTFQVSANTTDFSKVRKWLVNGDKIRGFQELRDIPVTGLTLEERQLRAFTMGLLSQELGHYDEVLSFISEDKSPLRKEYRHFILGKKFHKTGDHKKAVKEFEKVIALKPSRNILYETHLELGRVAMERKQWRRAHKNLRFIERKWKNTHRHPEILWRLIKVELKRKRKGRACHWARQIYFRYPVHALIYDWGIDLKTAYYEGKKLGCTVSSKDQIKRIRRLQWSGEADRARREIETLRNHSTPETQYDVDSMLVHFLIDEGYIDQAVKRLISYYEKEKKNFDYLMLLGRATSKSGEYPTAVGAYYKAHQLKPQGRLGREALFNAAFLSYQFQDYDGATRKFEEFIKKYKHSGLRRDTQYYLAWIRYLKGDYLGAIQKFNAILEKKKNYRRHWRKYPMERIKYWLAMSYMRLENNSKAYQLFNELQSSQTKGFYAVASSYRIHSLPVDFPVRNLGSEKSGNFPVNMELITFPNEEEASSGEEEESEDNMALDHEFDENEIKGTHLQAARDNIGIKGEDPPVTVFKDPNLQKRFDRATDFVQVGLWEWAKWELYEIERRTKRKAYLKKLVKSYEEIGSFNRSAYISSIYLGNERRRGRGKSSSLDIDLSPSL